MNIEVFAHFIYIFIYFEEDVILRSELDSNLSEYDTQYKPQDSKETYRTAQEQSQRAQRLKQIYRGFEREEAPPKLFSSCFTATLIVLNDPVRLSLGVLSELDNRSKAQIDV